MRTRKLGLCLFAFGAMSSGYASSFQIWEQDGASVGLYHAGYAAGAFDASTVFYNPAGMSFLPRPQLSVGGALIRTDAQFDGVVIRKSPLTKQSAVSANGGVSRFVPSLHMVYPLNERWAMGLSLAAPFGFVVDYGQATDLRYATVKTEAKVINLTPSISYKMTPETAIGIGLDIQRMQAQFVQYVGLTFPPQLSTPAYDTLSDNNVSGYGYGGHVGIMHQMNSQTRLGLSYHSQVSHRLTGSSVFKGGLAKSPPPPIPLDSNASLQNNLAEAKITLPAYIAMGIFHQWNDRLSVMGNIVYTQWSSVSEIRLNNLQAISSPSFNPAVYSVGLPKSYRDTFNLSVGGQYVVTDNLTLKLALGYDQTPERAELRDLHIPDNNRFITAIGMNYKINSALNVDAGWSHFITKKFDINSPELKVGATSTKQVGSVDGKADAFGIQLNWSFT